MGSEILSRKHSAPLEPKTFDQAVAFAEQISHTSFVPDHFRGKPADILAAMQFGSELGLGPLQSLNGIAMISGKPTMYASTMRALVEASGLMEKCEVTYQSEPPLATVVVRRVGRENATFSFGYTDATRANLAGRDMYKKYPERMYTARAMSFALRDEFADVLRGMLAAEEMDEAGTVVNEAEDFSRLAHPSNGDAAQGLLAALTPELAATVVKGFTTLGFNSAKQLVLLRQYEGRVESLVKMLRDTYRDRTASSSADIGDQDGD